MTHFTAEARRQKCYFYASIIYLSVTAARRCCSGSLWRGSGCLLLFFKKNHHSPSLFFLTADLFPASHMRFSKSSLSNGNAHYSTNRTHRRLIDCKQLTRCKVRTLFCQYLSSVALYWVYCGSGIKMKNSQSWSWNESLHFRFCRFLLLSAALSYVFVDAGIFSLLFSFFLSQ